MAGVPIVWMSFSSIMFEFSFFLLLFTPAVIFQCGKGLLIEHSSIKIIIAILNYPKVKTLK